MCGFVTFYHPRGTGLPDAGRVKKLSGIMRQRGPDSEGQYADEYVRIGHRRLSILDLSERATQPMRDEHLVIAYNGEIFNFIELRDELARDHGVHCRTSSDTEVILKAYQTYGPRCVERLNGMFAFTIWDVQERRLFVARDRLGVKPLFWAKTGSGAYMFASDVRVMWSEFPPGRSMDIRAVGESLVHGFYLGEATASPHVHRFPQAHYLELASGDEKPTLYWRISASSQRKVSFPEAVEATDALLGNAVALRLRSDVPVGCFLSGGLDSTLVTSYAAAQGRGMRTFSIGVDAARLDESAIALKVARHFGTDHHSVMLGAEGLESLPRIVHDFGDVFGDSSALPAWFVSQAAAREVKVVFSGDGGDELFGGYVIPFAVYLSERIDRWPAIARVVLDAALRQLPVGASATSIRWAARFAELRAEPVEQTYRRLSIGSVFGAESHRFVQNPGEGRALESLNRIVHASKTERVLLAELADRFVNDYLVKLDLATMAHSLEGRSPFLDYRLVELAFSLPHGVRYHRLRRKAILKELCSRHFPREFTQRRKMGFSVPIAEWMWSERYREVIHRLIRRPSTLDEVVGREFTRDIWARFEHDPRPYASQVWSLLWYQLWDGLFVSRVYDPEAGLTESAGMAHGS